MKNTLEKEESGQALLELSFAFVLLAVFVFGIVDFGQAVYDAEVMKNLSGEGSSLASRGTPPATVAQSVITDADSSINLAKPKAQVMIVTVVTNAAGTLQVTGQASQCAITATSKIGCVQGQSGCSSSSPTLPAGATSALQGEVSGSSLFITEIYYAYNTTTPISGFLQERLASPGQLYSVAYY